MSTLQVLVGGHYKGNSEQMIQIEKHLEAGDVFLLGINEKTVTYTQGTDVKTAAGRDFIAYHFVKEWATLGTAGGEGWKTDLKKLKDLSSTIKIKFK